MVEQIKRNDGEGEFNYDIFKKFDKCHNLSPNTTIIKMKNTK
jgi:hypothetical protein